MPKLFGKVPLPDAEVGPIINLATGEEMSEEDKAELRAMLKTKGIDAIQMPDDLRKDLEANGITSEMVLQAFLRAASNKLQ
jgi:hypothetical protein